MTEVAPASLGVLTGPPDKRPCQNSAVEALIRTGENQNRARNHQLFVWLLTAQWAIAVCLAASLFPSRTAAWPLTLIIGGLLAVPCLLLIRFQADRSSTRYALAAAQAGFSAVFIHLSSGQAGSHFHIFGSLAFLALYRDWKILPVAAGVMLSAQLAASQIWTDSLAAVPTPTLTEIIQFAGWLAFEGVALSWLCVLSRREMIRGSQRQVQHQQLLDELEQRVRERTRALETEMQARESTAQELRHNEQRHRNLVATVPMGIFETTRSGKINFANPHLMGLIGLPEAFDPTAISLADGRIFVQSERDRFWARLERDREVRGFASLFRRFDGSTFDVVINAQLKQSSAGAELVCEGTLEDVTARKRAERELEALHSQLVIASRQAGMAEVASGVLHNVGNVLTSVNLIVHDVQDRLKTTRLSHLRRVVEILQREQPRLVQFLTEEGGGRQLPDFLGKLDEHLTSENSQLLADVEGLVRHFEHIREIIVTQQGSAQLFGVLETLAPAQLFEDALRLNAESMERHAITLERVFEPVGHTKADRHKVLQILVNLLKNAKDALKAIPSESRIVRVAVKSVNAQFVALSVHDNGLGILPENLTRIFQHGFTTKPSGHGFGLHSSVLAAREMGGDLIATSAGLGTGSTFTLTLPRVRMLS